MTVTLGLRVPCLVATVDVDCWAVCEKVVPGTEDVSGAEGPCFEASACEINPLFVDTVGIEEDC